MENIFPRHIVALQTLRCLSAFSSNVPNEIFVEAFSQQNIIIIIVIVASHHSHQL